MVSLFKRGADHLTPYARTDGVMSRMSPSGYERTSSESLLNVRF